MHPVLRTTCTRNLLVQSSKTVTKHINRMYVPNPDEIKLPPEPTTCCMTGCANCVWIEYAETLSKLLDGNSDKARNIVLEKISDPNLKVFLTLELQNLQYQKDIAKK